MRALALRHGLLAAALLLALGVSNGEAAGSCTVSVSSIAFGSYDVFVPVPTDSTGTIVLTCNGGARDVAIALGRGQTGTFSGRKLTKAGDALSYNVFLDAARTTIWGDGSGATAMWIEANPPNNKDVSRTMFGRVPATQEVSAGSYTDTLTVTVNF